MATLLTQLNAPLPAGWRVTHLIDLEPMWQCNITNDEYVTLATGDTVEDAITNAAVKASNNNFVGRLFHLGSSKPFFTDEELTEFAAEGKGSISSVDLREVLGLNRPKVTITRRV